MSLYLFLNNVTYKLNDSDFVLFSNKDKIKQIFITGSTGTVGKAILEKLLKEQIIKGKTLYILHNFIRSSKDPFNELLQGLCKKLVDEKNINNFILETISKVEVYTNKVYEFKKSYEINCISIKVTYDDNTSKVVYIFYENYNIGHDGLEDDLFLEKKFLKFIKNIAGSDNPQKSIVGYPDNINTFSKFCLDKHDKKINCVNNIREAIQNDPKSAYKQNKDKACSYILINSVMDKDAQAVRINMNGKKITDVRKHWSIKLAAQISKVTNYHFIKLIHISTVYVNKGIVPVNGWAPIKVALGEPPNMTDDYVYGYAKAAAENVIMANDPSALIVRLPGIFDNNLKHVKLTDLNNESVLLYYALKPLLETSPSTVVNKLVYISKLTNNTTYTVDHSQLRFPITSQDVAEFFIKLIDLIHDADVEDHDSNIINLGGSAPMTKYELASLAEEKYNTGRKVIPSATSTFNSLPSSEKMIMEKDSLPKCIKNVSSLENYGTINITAKEIIESISRVYIKAK